MYAGNNRGELMRMIAQEDLKGIIGRALRGDFRVISETAGWGRKELCGIGMCDTASSITKAYCVTGPMHPYQWGVTTNHRRIESRKAKSSRYASFPPVEAFPLGQ